MTESSRPEIANRTNPDRPLPGAMPDRLSETAPKPEFDAKSIAKNLLRTVRAGALATIDRNSGHPFGSLANVATDSDGSPLILISRLSSHTANLETDRRASVLLATSGKGDPLAHPRHLDIENGEIGRRRLKTVERRGAVGVSGDPVAFGFECD